MFSKIKTFILGFVDDWMNELGGSTYPNIMAALFLAFLVTCLAALVIGLPFIGIPVVVIAVLVYRRAAKKNEKDS